MTNLKKLPLFILACCLIGILAYTNQRPKAFVSNYEKLHHIKQLDRFSFGSCNKEYLENNLWGSILADKPQLFIWGGDNIYGDRGDNAGDLKGKYETQNAHPGYQALKATTPIMGIWDDHDYGINDAGAENPDKEKNKHLLLDFLDIPLNAAVRYRDGIYQSYTLGTNDRKVKFILLDNRYNLTEDNVLGDNQWAWLDEELQNSTAAIHFIVGGISIIGPKIPNSQQWANYSSEQDRLVSLLKTHNTSGVVFLTGDKHFSGVSEKFGFVEVMSSGMTHTKKGGGLLRTYLKTKYKRTFFKKNYASVNINWDNTPLTIDFKYQGEKKSKAFSLLLSNNQFTLEKK